MMEVDDSQFANDEQEFLTEWTLRLDVPLGVLITRIVQATIDADRYVSQRPD
jgi:hypothetical protein